MTAYYNEIDPYAAAWLRNLIAAGHIADGVVDERSIVDVRPEDLAGFAQVHLFAGLGGWSHAARLAGWPDDRPLWTGSCPCQPFSNAGKRAGTEDERHLWPEMHRLVAAIRPPVVVGEQVASRAGLAWLDGVCADLEAAGYATGAIDLCAASVGAAHIRQRLWWVAYAQHDGQREHRHGLGSAARGDESEAPERQRLRLDPADGGAACRVAYAGSEGRGQVCENTRGGRSGSPETGVDERSMHGGTLRGLAHSPGAGPQGSGSGWGPRQGREGTAAERGGEVGRMGDADNVGSSRRGDTGGGQGLGLKGPQSTRADATGFWSNADHIPCRDGKARPVEPGTFPLAHGISNRVGRLRAYGNAIVPQVAAEVLRAIA